MRRLFGVAATLALAACETAGPTTAKIVVDVPPVMPPAPAVPTPTIPAHYDFRMAGLDPAVIGSTAKCDVQLIEDKGEAALVTCIGHGGHWSKIALAIPREARAAVVPRTQIEVRITGGPEAGTDAEARTTFVGITGELEPPEPPSRCLCDRDRELARETANPPPAKGWNFSSYERDRNKYWGTRQTCRINLVTEIGRSSPDSREYSVGRVFEPEQLPYAAHVWCTDGGDVIVGADSAYQILDLARDQAIEVELGWSQHGYGATAKLIRTTYRPERSDD